MTRNAKLEVDVGYVLDNRWRINTLLGEGAFGAVYECSDVNRRGKMFAVKIESNDDVTPKSIPLEVTVLRKLRDRGAAHYPGYESCGQNDKFTYVVMGLVGRNLNSVRKSLPGKRFSLRSALHIGTETLIGIQEIHDAGYLHRDIKPENMAVGRTQDDLRKIYILDWGLCRKHIDGKGKVRQRRIRADFRGTPRYASANALENVDQSRADDVWSWMFTLVDLTIGKLPWDEEDEEDEEDENPEEEIARLARLGAKKRKCVDDPKIMMAECPAEYRQIYDSLVVCEYAHKPDYDGYRIHLNAAMKRNGYKDATPLDWESEEGNGANVSETGRKEGSS